MHYRFLLLPFALAAWLFAFGSFDLRGEETPPPVIGEEEAHSEGINSSAGTPPVVSGPLRRSDVLLSPRFYRADWLQALRGFSANRIVWTYAGDRLVAEAAAHGVPVQCTLPVWVPKDEAEKDAMACVDPSGNPRIAGAGVAVFPDANSEAWRSYVLDEVERLVDAGCTSFQQDGAWLDFRSDLSSEGLLLPESRAAFDAFVEEGQPDIARLESSDAEDAEGPSDAGETMRQATPSKPSKGNRWPAISIGCTDRSKLTRRRTLDLDVTFSGNFATRC